MFTVGLLRPEKPLKKIIRLIGENNQITIEELSEQLGESRQAIEMQIKKVKDRKLLERIGPDIGGYWQLTREQS